MRTKSTAHYIMIDAMKFNDYFAIFRALSTWYKIGTLECITQ